MTEKKLVSIKDRWEDSGEVPVGGQFPIESAAIQLFALFDLPGDRLIAQYQFPSLGNQLALIEIIPNYDPVQQIELIHIRNVTGPWGLNPETDGIKPELLDLFYRTKSLASGLINNVRAGTFEIRTGTFFRDFDKRIPGVKKAQDKARKKKALSRSKTATKKASRKK